MVEYSKMTEEEIEERLQGNTRERKDAAGDDAQARLVCLISECFLN